MAQPEAWAPPAIAGNDKTSGWAELEDRLLPVAPSQRPRRLAVQADHRDAGLGVRPAGVSASRKLPRDLPSSRLGFQTCLGSGVPLRAARQAAGIARGDDVNRQVGRDGTLACGPAGLRRD
jgi:hypothetical protein